MIHEAVIDRTLKIGVQGEQGRPWSESEVPGADAINLHDEDWHVFDESYGTDQEKYLIRFIHDHKDLLRKRFEEFYLVRNEKMVTIYSFDSGRAFEPDFILFLREKGDDAMTTLQVFIEPKGKKLMPDEQWKQSFLARIGDEFKLSTLFNGRDYLIRGLPFYNSSSAAAPEFQKSFDALLDI
jgi:type III restriction enzyme